jgi:hypothetical protein
MALDFEAEDKAEKAAQAQRNKDGKYMLLAGLVAIAAIAGDELFHWTFGGSGLSMIASWILGFVVIFTCGCATNWVGTEFHELRTRTKEINGKLTEITETLERLNGRR